MTDQHPHTPTTRDIRMAYVDSISRNNPNDYGDDRAKEISAEFFRWLTAHEEEIRQEEREDIAAAEQRGAIKALRDAAGAIEKNQIMTQVGHLQPCNSCMVIHMDFLDYRANQIEGDDE